METNEAQEESDHIVVITGATGLLGRAVVKRFAEYWPKWTVISTGFTRSSPPVVAIDLMDFERVELFIKSKRPSIVIYAATKRYIPTNADSRTEVEEIDVIAPKHLAKVTAALEIPMIYISTDLVFDGTKDVYEPEDDANPTNMSGILRLNGEVEVLNENPSAYVFRVPTEQSSESLVNGLVDVVLNVTREQRLDCDNWHIQYPTNTDDVARVLKDVSERILSQQPQDKPVPRKMHFSATQKYTKFEICEIFGELLGVPITHLQRIDDMTKDISTRMAYPRNCHLSNKKLEYLGVDVSSVDFVQWWKRHLLPARR
ncbi:uncharacterized protein V1518DRAFT_415152 [Limtongia smithiae]|uniref:uncharacterized protein n=1 Tax=Limtongia smithiae TaxID=1125753 RepID=UPI0034CDC82E